MSVHFTGDIMNYIFTLATAILLCANASAQTTAAETPSSDNSNATSSYLDLSTNECLNKLSSNDPVIASIAFKDGVTGFSQLKELVERKPWGEISATTAKEIEAQIETQSPFLIITLTKEQTLTLDNHRDIIRWILVQSTTTTCE